MAGFVKRRADAPPGFFAAEAAGLRWLAAAREADAGAAAIVGVIDVGEGWIELERVDEARPTAEAARAFGAALARTHAAGAPAFGAPPDGWDGPNFIGRQEAACRPAPDWPTFYAEQRVLPYLRRAVDRGHVSPSHAGVVEESLAVLAAIGEPEPPSRLHGDLWTGNVLWTARGAVLVDPAAHGGHRETDLAMLDLFGLPYLSDVLDGYDAERPLAPGWRDRIPMHQLHPLAVHAASHGAGYAAPLVDAARATLALA